MFCSIAHESKNPITHYINDFQVVEKIDEPETYLPHLHILGQKHVMYEIDVNHIDQMGYMFLSGIKTALENKVSHLCHD